MKPTIKSGANLFLLAICVAAPVNVASVNARQMPSGQVNSNSIVESKLDDMAWIAGHWQGEAMGGTFEETWNPPFAGSMMGMFKFVKDGEIVFYEFLTIVEKDSALVLRLKHFDKSLTGWEEKDESIEFPFISSTESEVVFDGLRFQRVDERSMRITVKIKEGDELKVLEFICKRHTGSTENKPEKSIRKQKNRQ